MHIDHSYLRDLREAIQMEGGWPPWEIPAALDAFGVTPDDDIAASRNGGRIQVLAKKGAFLILIVAESSVASWWRNVGETPVDFSIEVQSFPLASIRSIGIEALDHVWAQHGSRTSLHGQWAIDVDGLDAPILAPVHHDDARWDVTPFVRRLIAGQSQSE